MRNFMIATIGLSMSLGLAGAAIAQSAATPGQMQTAPATNGDSSTMNPSGPASGSAPSTSATQGDPATNDNTATSGAASGMSGGMSSGSAGNGNMTAPAPQANQSYPRCSATVHDECRQRN